jgi:PAS domain S-box-containing protein
MSRLAYALFGLTAITAILVGMLVVAVLRFLRAAREARTQPRGSGRENDIMMSALEEAVSRLKTQERAVSARAEAVERLSDQIVTSLTAGLLVVGLDGETRILNPAGQRLLGLQPEQTSGQFRQVLAGQEPLAEAVEECLRTAEPLGRRALAMAQPARGVTHLGVGVSPLFDGHGRPLGAICLFTDLTAVMDLEEQLRLKDSLARLGELTAGLAHEFRNGLATVHGYARLIDAAGLPPAHRPYLEGIRSETDALGAMVSNFLNFARPAQLTLAPVSLREVLDRSVGEMRPETTAKLAAVELSGDFATIEGDEILLRQAFGNVLRNSLEACGERGVTPQIRIMGQIDEVHRMARITVSDNGPGIDPSIRDRVFRPFFTSKPDGTGLGLALVQKIVVTHNGRVSAGSAEGGGAAVHVELPLPPSHPTSGL